MNGWRALLILLAVLALLGCEGGIGGTGTGAPPPDSSEPGGHDGATGIFAVLVTGEANKGPYAEGTLVAPHRLAGPTLDQPTSTHGALGKFELTLQSGVPYQLDAAGRYFSEFLGDVSGGEVTLSAIVVAGTTRANINLATHIANLRVRELIDSGFSAQAAIDTAEAELIAALVPVMPAPSNPIHFSDLVVLNAAQGASNREGDAWLLALTSMIERAAITASDANGTTGATELVERCDRLAQDFADDGVIDVTLLEELHDAAIQIDPDRIATHLFEFALLHVDELSLDDVDSATVESLLFQLDSAQSGTDGSTMETMCEAFGDEVLCAKTGTFPQGSESQVMMQLGGTDSGNFFTMPLEDMVANMNRFIDTDDDGVVNTDDDDDDNDGIPDKEDDTPYGG